MPLLHPSITETKELELVHRLIGSPFHQQDLLAVNGILAKDAVIHENVEHRLFRKKLTSDTDILVIPRGRPDLSSAIQVKRFQARVGISRTIRPIDLQWMKDLYAKGVDQANYAAQQVGFGQVWLWVFILFDLREQNAGSIGMEGPDSALSCAIRRIVTTDGLDPRVGVMTFEWEQPQDLAPFTNGAHGKHFSRPAATVTQSTELNAWLDKLT